MQLTDLITTAITAFLTAAVTWFFSRQKQKAEVKANELDNVDKAVAIWRGLAEELTKKVAELSARCESLSVEIEGLRRENRGLKADLQKAIKDIKNA